jgi:allantoicase
MSIHEPKAFCTRYVNLAQPRLGAQALVASDEFFAPKERMLEPQPAVFVPGKYDTNGKWMDGWESRRKRVAGHDYCIVKLGLAGTIKGIDIDTSHFTGNFPPAALLDACRIVGDPNERTDWTTIVAATRLKGNSHHYIDVASDQVWTHVRLNIFPDGGIARLRVYGEVACDWPRRDRSKTYDLIALENGGRIIGCNDAHFGAPENLLAPARSVNMGDGWETRRRREPGNDWVVIALGTAGIIKEIRVDTAHFKGNYPDRCSLQAARVGGGTDESLITQSMFWEILLPEQKLQMDAEQVFKDAIRPLGAITHVRFNIHPDGGVSRLRLFGSPE